MTPTSPTLSARTRKKLQRETACVCGHWIVFHKMRSGNGECFVVGRWPRCLCKRFTKASAA